MLGFLWIIFFYPLFKALRASSGQLSFENILRSFYLPQSNLQLGEISGINIHWYVYGVLSFFLIIGYYVKHHWLAGRALPPCFHPKTVVIAFLALVIAGQTANRLMSFGPEIRYYITKDKQQRYFSFFRGLHDFARQCKNVLPGAHNAEFISDLDFSEEVPGLFTYWCLSYYLYPIDIKDIHPQKSKDCVIVFSGNNPKSRLPRDSYEKIYLIGNQGLVAIKKQ